MRYVYIELKTPLKSAVIRTEPTYNGSSRGGDGNWELRDVSTGQVVLTLPSSVQELNLGMLYEDAAILVRM
jgi:hypothetical protein